MPGSCRNCEICGIRERYSADKLFFARFPSSEKVCIEWVKLVGKQDLVYLPIEKLHSLRFVCEKHFGKRDFTKTRTRLKKHAVPKHQLAMPPLTEEQMAGFPFHMAKSQMNASMRLRGRNRRQRLGRRGASTKTAAHARRPTKKFGPVQLVGILMGLERMYLLGQRGVYGPAWSIANQLGRVRRGQP